MLINIEIKDYSFFDLIFIQCYDFHYKNNQSRFYKYDCPLLQITNMYNVMLIKSIIELVQIIQHTEQQNECYVLCQSSDQYWSMHMLVWINAFKTSW